MDSESHTNPPDETPVRRPVGRPRKAPPTAEPLFVSRDLLAHLLGVSTRTTYFLEKTDPDFPIPVNIGAQKRFVTAEAKGYAATKIERARAKAERRAKNKQRNSETA